MVNYLWGSKNYTPAKTMTLLAPLLVLKDKPRWKCCPLHRAIASGPATHLLQTGTSALKKCLFHDRSEKYNFNIWNDKCSLFLCLHNICKETTLKINVYSPPSSTKAKNCCRFVTSRHTNCRDEQQSTLLEAVEEKPAPHWQAFHTIF